MTWRTIIRRLPDTAPMRSEASVLRSTQADMHILLDLVPGHTSVAHPWFKESCKADRNEFTDRYIWTDSTWGQLENMGSLCGISEREAL